MTLKQYAQFELAFKTFMESEDIQILSSTGDESYFSWSCCDCCRTSLGGSRVDAKGSNPGSAETRDYSICLNCEHYAAYGRLDDVTMMEML